MLDPTERVEQENLDNDRSVQRSERVEQENLDNDRSVQRLFRRSF